MIDKVNFFGRNRRGDRAERGRLSRILVLSLLALVPACAFQPPAALPPPGPFLTQLQRLPVAPITESGEDTIVEETGTMAIYQGYACAESREKGRQKVLHVQQAHDVPREMNRATVILSGWRFRYLNGDHNVLGLGTAIFGIAEGDKRISWDAAGIISDDDFEDPYRWCYHYTLIAWNTAAFAVRPDHRDDFAFSSENRDFDQSSLTVHPAFVAVKDYPPNAAILPRGFGFVWRQRNTLGEIVDYNLLQLAYNLDHSERYIADGKSYLAPRPPGLSGADQVAGSFQSWETKTIFKDNGLRHDHDTAELISVISGPRIRMIEPPFTITPFEAISNCVALGDEESQTRKVDLVPFDLAIPVLTGWDLSYICGDQNVEEIGTWIESFNYEPNQGEVRTTAGMRPSVYLRYTIRSLLRDEDRNDSNRFRHRVSILGFDRER